MLGRPTDSLPHLPSRPTNKVGLQRPPAVVSWALPPAFGCTACRLRRAGTHNRHAPKGTATPADCSGCPPLCEDGSAGVAPTQLFGRLVRSVPVFRPKTTRLPHQVCHLDRLGCCPNPCCAPAVFRSQAHCKSSSLAPLNQLQPNLKPAVSGLFVLPVSAAPAVPDGTGLRPGWTLSQQVASSHFWLRPTGSPSKRATSLFCGWTVGRYQLWPKNAVSGL